MRKEDEVERARLVYQSDAHISHPYRFVDSSVDQRLAEPSSATLKCDIKALHFADAIRRHRPNSNASKRFIGCGGASEKE